MLDLTSLLVTAADDMPRVRAGRIRCSMSPPAPKPATGNQWRHMAKIRRRIYESQKFGTETPSRAAAIPISSRSVFWLMADRIPSGNARTRDTMKLARASLSVG